LQFLTFELDLKSGLWHLVITQVSYFALSQGAQGTSISPAQTAFAALPLRPRRLDFRMIAAGLGSALIAITLRNRPE